MDKQEVKLDYSNLIDFLLEVLHAPGTEPVIRLRNCDQFYDEKFLRDCVEDIKRLERTSVLEPPSKLEKLALWTLLAHAEAFGYDPEKVKSDETKPEQ